MIGKIVPVFVLIFAIGSQRSFVDTAPAPPPAVSQSQQGSPEMVPETLDANVRELESLKQSIGKTLEMMKTHSSVYTEVNGHKESQSDSRSEVKEDGKLLARVGQHIEGQSPGADGRETSGRVRTEVEIPSKGIHKSLVEQLSPEYPLYTENGNRRSAMPGYDAPQESNTLEKYGTYSGTQYSPLDMAEYVFWTGDEKGVTLAIEEFLQEGLMSREDAILFLQQIKYNLDYLQSHYTQLGMNGDHSKDNNKGLKSQRAQARPELKSNFDLNKLRQQVKKNEQDYKKEEDISIPKLDVSQPEEEYDELLERLRVADFLYTEYSLEEVIYQLAKVMFTQSLTRGSAEAQQALQKFTTFLETEADQGHISRSLEKKVLDVLIASLTDTLNEHPEVSGGPGETSPDGQAVLRQILQMSPEDKAGIQSALSQSQNRNSLESLRSPLDIQLKDKSHVPLSIGKYKTIR